VKSDTVVLDASVLVAIFKSEADSRQIIEHISSYKRKVLSAAAWLEAAIVCEGASAKSGGGAELDRLVSNLSVEIIAVSAEQAALAFHAFKRFGKGRGAKAALNFGDCFVYALAKDLNAPLLFKGDDFAQTDLQRA
jgi:ribonuclease VapC